MRSVWKSTKKKMHAWQPCMSLSTSENVAITKSISYWVATWTWHSHSLSQSMVSTSNTTEPVSKRKWCSGQVCGESMVVNQLILRWFWVSLSENNWRLELKKLPNQFNFHMNAVPHPAWSMPCNASMDNHSDLLQNSELEFCPCAKTLVSILMWIMLLKHKWLELMLGDTCSLWHLWTLPFSGAWGFSLTGLVAHSCVGEGWKKP